MNTIQLIKLFDKYPHGGIFKGVYPCDKLPKKISLPAALIVNLSKSNHQGSHWISIYIDSRRQAEYFDSLGFAIKNWYIKDFLTKNCKKISYNKQQLQHISSNYCGLYAFNFIIYKLQGGSIADFCKKFSKNTIINDIFIHNQHTYYVNTNV